MLKASKDTKNKTQDTYLEVCRLEVTISSLVGKRTLHANKKGPSALAHDGSGRHHRALFRLGHKLGCIAGAGQWLEKELYVVMVTGVAKVVNALPQEVNVVESQVTLDIVREIDEVTVLGEHKDKAI